MSGQHTARVFRRAIRHGDFVAPMRQSLEELKQGCLIRILFHPVPFGEPIWGLTVLGRMAVNAARAMIATGKAAAPKEEL